MSELSDYFSGEKALTRVKKNENLMKWFKAVGGRIAALDFTDSTVAGRRIQQVGRLGIWGLVLMIIYSFFYSLKHLYQYF